MGNASKLSIKPGNTVRVLGRISDDEFAEAVGDLPAGASLVTRGRADVVLAFVETKRELDALVAKGLLDSVVERGFLWVNYPKLTSGRGELSRDIVWHTFDDTGWRPVTNRALSDVWTALRFRPLVDVGT